MAFFWQKYIGSDAAQSFRMALDVTMCYYWRREPRTSLSYLHPYAQLVNICSSSIIFLFLSELVLCSGLENLFSPLQIYRKCMFPFWMVPLNFSQSMHPTTESILLLGCLLRTSNLSYPRVSYTLVSGHSHFWGSSQDLALVDSSLPLWQHLVDQKMVTLTFKFRLGPNFLPPSKLPPRAKSSHHLLPGMLWLSHNWSLILALTLECFMFAGAIPTFQKCNSDCIIPLPEIWYFPKLSSSSIKILFAMPFNDLWFRLPSSSAMLSWPYLLRQISHPLWECALHFWFFF